MGTRPVRLTAKLLVAIVLLAGARQGHAADGPTLEQQVKSAFVVNFLQFTEWPDSAFEKANDPIIIGVLDAKSLGEGLSGAHGMSVRGRPLVIKPVTVETIGKCHALIVGKLEEAESQEVIKAAGAAPILTIGDSEMFTRQGGIIRFYAEGGKMHFEINQSAAERVHLQLSSKLLKLAKVANY